MNKQALALLHTGEDQAALCELSEDTLITDDVPLISEKAPATATWLERCPADLPWHALQGWIPDAGSADRDRRFAVTDGTSPLLVGLVHFGLHPPL